MMGCKGGSENADNEEYDNENETRLFDIHWEVVAYLFITFHFLIKD